MRKGISMILAAILLLCPLTAGAVSTEDMVPYTGIQENQYLLDMKLGDHVLWEWGEEYLLCEVTWNSLLLEEESAQRFPELARTLEKMNLAKLLAMQDEMAWMLPIAQDVANENMYCTSESKYYVQRSDDVMLSVREDVYAFTGGAHPNTGTFGINIDCESGEELKLSDVLTDTKHALEIAADMLNEEYSIGEFMDVDEAIANLTEGELEWTMDEKGLTLYFYPGQIAPYAAGQMNVTLWYEDHFELFNGKYLPIYCTAYAKEIPLFEEIEIDLVKGDDKRDVLSVSAYMDAEGYAYEQYFITINGEALNVAERYSYYVVPYLLTIDDGHAVNYYLYIDETSDNDYHSLSIFALTEEGARFETEISGIGFGSQWDMEREASYSDVFNNPADFRLATRLDILGTMTGFKHYSVHEDSGYFIAQEDWYDVSDAEMQVSSLFPMEVTMLDTNEKETMPAHTTFTFLRTDGYTYMEAQLDDGRECRIPVRRDYEGNSFITTVEGEKIDWECFEEVFYAG